jgi:transposase
VAAIDAMQRRMDLAPQSLMKLRRRDRRTSLRAIKARMGHTHFLMKRLKNVKTEMSLHVLAYNLKRVMQILGARPLIAAIRT